MNEVQLELTLWYLDYAVRDTKRDLEQLGGTAALTLPQLSATTRSLEVTVQVLVPLVEQLRTEAIRRMQEAVKHG